MKRKREAVLEMIRDHGGVLPFRDLMQAFGVSKAQREGFKTFVDSLVTAGDLVRMQGNR
jgi:ribonuclease R